MNEEVEIQVVLKNPEEVELKLREVARFVKEKIQKDEYFTPVHENFFSLDIPVKYLRVRHEDGKNELAYLFLHLNEDKFLSKTDEYEVKLDNPEMMSIILKKLDMENKVTVTKNGKTFHYGDFEVCLDYIKELGYFIEIEAKKIVGSIDETRKRCFEILSDLGAEWKELPVGFRGYPIMVLAKQAGKLDYIF